MCHADVMVHVSENWAPETWQIKTYCHPSVTTLREDQTDLSPVGKRQQATVYRHKARRQGIIYIYIYTSCTPAKKYREIQRKPARLRSLPPPHRLSPICQSICTYYSGQAAGAIIPCRHYRGATAFCRVVSCWQARTVCTPEAVAFTGDHT